MHSDRVHRLECFSDITLFDQRLELFPLAIREKMGSTTNQTGLIQSTEDCIRTHMSKYDASHDYSHIQRVVRLAHHIHQVESTTHPEIACDKLTVTLAALVHDVGDHKYLAPGQTLENAQQAAEKMLIALGAEPLLAAVVQLIANAVSYSHERRNPDLVQRLVKQHPELAIVQDADRLDAIGAVGIARMFTFNGAKGTAAGNMQDTFEHVNDKLFKLEGMMKTEEGKRLARERTERLRTFQTWWEEEHQTLVE